MSDTTPRDAAERAQAANLAPVLTEAALNHSRYLYATSEQIDAMVLGAAASHIADKATVVTLPRFLFTAQEEEAGKTSAMTMTALLCANPVDAAGTWYGVQSAIAAAGQEGRPCPTLYRDEIREVFGASGMGDGKQVGDVIRRGYRYDGTLKWSVNRQDVTFSCFGVFLMTGLRSAVPRDVRSRCIVIDMKRGRPHEYFDIRDSEQRVRQLARSLGMAVRGNRDKIRAFRVRTLRHPKLAGRKGEVWEAMFAVAAAAGPEWLSRCMRAFTALALNESDQVVLSPGQQMVSDLAAVAAAASGGLTWHGEAFAPGRALYDELRRAYADRYGELTDATLGANVRDALHTLPVPLPSRQCRLGDKIIRGYVVPDLAAAWESIRPADPDDVEVTADVDPFADEDVTGEWDGDVLDDDSIVEAVWSEAA